MAEITENPIIEIYERFKAELVFRQKTYLSAKAMSERYCLGFRLSQ